MGLVIDAARQHGYPAPLAGATEQLFLAGRRAGLGREDDSSVIEILRGGASVPAAADLRRDSELRLSMIITVSSRLMARRAPR
jgi:hypothetical protein